MGDMGSKIDALHCVRAYVLTWVLTYVHSIKPEHMKLRATILSVRGLLFCQASCNVFSYILTLSHTST